MSIILGPKIDLESKLGSKNRSWTKFWLQKSILHSFWGPKIDLGFNFELKIWSMYSKVSQITKLMTLWHALTYLESTDEVRQFHGIFLPQWVFAANYTKQFALDEFQTICSVDRIFIDKHHRQLGLLFFGLDLKIRYKLLKKKTNLGQKSMTQKSSILILAQIESKIDFYLQNFWYKNG